VDKGEELLAEEDMSLSALLLSVAEDRQGLASIDEIVGWFGRRAFGGVLFFFAIPNLLPLPPGSSAVLGLPLLIIAPQLAFGASRPWLPAMVGKRTLQRSTLSDICRRAAPWVRKIEHLTTRRFGLMFGRLGDLTIGAVCTLLAAVLILPIPLGNMLPAAAVATLAFSLTQRDGLLTLLGYLLAMASVGALVIGGRLSLGAINGLGSLTGLW
jgi:hypothetical protein